VSSVVTIANLWVRGAESCRCSEVGGGGRGSLYYGGRQSPVPRFRPLVLQMRAVCKRRLQVGHKQWW
jgi:hypothetical protein